MEKLSHAKLYNCTFRPVVWPGTKKNGKPTQWALVYVVPVLAHQPQDLWIMDHRGCEIQKRLKENSLKMAHRDGPPLETHPRVSKVVFLGHVLDVIRHGPKGSHTHEVTAAVSATAVNM